MLLDLDLKTIQKNINEKVIKEKNFKLQRNLVVIMVVFTLFGLSIVENFTDNNFNEIENKFNEFKKRVKEDIDNDTLDEYKYNLFVKEMEAQLDYFSKKYNYSIDYILKKLNINTNIYELPLEQVIY
jgi:hypothetical protein